MLMKVAKKLTPAWLKNAVKRLLGSGSPYQGHSFQVIDTWPEVEHAQNWADPAVVQRYIDDFRSFDFNTLSKNPIVQENLRGLEQIRLQKAKLLDVGCANGLYRPLLASFPPTRDWEYCGADLSPELIAFCRIAHPGTRFEVITNSPGLPFTDDEFDVVLASSVLFAIRDYRPFLEELRRVSKTYVFVSRQPVWKYRPTQILTQRVVYAGREERHPVRFFNRSELETIFQEIGFEIVTSDYSEICHIVVGIAEPAIDHYYLLSKR